MGQVMLLKFGQYLFQLLIQSCFFNVFSDNGVQRVPKLMRDTGVDKVGELVFGFELVIKDMVCHVHDLKHFNFLTIALVLFHHHLHVSGSIWACF